MANYVPDIFAPVIIPRGLSIARELVVYSGTSPATVTGSYVLYDASGTSVASGSVVAGSVTISVPSDLALGAGAYEVWTLTAPLVTQIRQPVYVSVSLDSRWGLVSTAQVTVMRSWLGAAFPAGRSDWENECIAATREVLRALVTATEWSSPTGMDLWDAAVLEPVALYTALAIIYRNAAGLTGAAHLISEAEDLERKAADRWERAGLAWGDGVGAGPDTLPSPPGSAGFPRPGPAGSR